MTTRPTKPDVTDDTIAAVIGQLLDQRGAGKSICPSDVARALQSAEPAWRALMPRIRAVAADLADRQMIRVTRGGHEVDARNPGGPIRLSRKQQARG